MSQWQDDFAKHATGTAFRLSLSHDQCDLLEFLAKGYSARPWKSRSGYSNFIPTFRSLERRGLAEHNKAALLVGYDTPHVKLKWVYRLTPAGERVYELLQMAGLTTSPKIKEVKSEEV